MYGGIYTANVQFLHMYNGIHNAKVYFLLLMYVYLYMYSGILMYTIG